MTVLRYNEDIRLQSINNSECCRQVELMFMGNYVCFSMGYLFSENIEGTSEVANASHQQILLRKNGFGLQNISSFLGHEELLRDCFEKI
ncbi:hypothetical protein TNCT_60001 [Trichonephila clavata]|uniref:Uncharacterized protein n=1 Tax=Trichonephila clavata TaxID=2740835 RepID=A0A8X6JPR6_TRICU|nr:hypothetical protein TNCT_60001 [Trichonephila clavata]